MSKDNKISINGTVTWIICTLFFAYEFLLRTISGTFQSPLMQDLDLTPIEFSLLSSTGYQFIYGIMQIPIGIIVDHLGLKKTIFTALLLCGVANLGFAYSEQFSSAIIFRMCVGLGSSCGFICLLIAIYDWMPQKNIALFIGISQFIGTIGPMFAAGPLNSITQEANLSWREIFFYLGLVGIIIAILALFLIKNAPQQQNKNTFIFLIPSKSIISNLKKLVKQKQIWFIAGYSACIYFSIEYLAENEGNEFLIKRGYSAEFSSYMLTLAWLGYAISSPLLGFFSDKIKRRKPFIIMCATSSLLALIMIIYAPFNQNILSISFVLLGLGASGSTIGFAMMAEQCTANTIRATGLGLNNTVIVLFAAFNAPFIGYLLSHLSIGGILLPVSYQKAFFVLLLVAVGALYLAVLKIKETFCKSMSENTILRLKKTQTHLEIA